MLGYVIDEQALEASSIEGDTASVRVAIDASCGCDRLEQRVVRYAPGRSVERSPEGDRQEVLYVADGRGTLYVNGEAHALEPNTGVYLTPDDRYQVENPGPDELVAVSVSAPQDTPVDDAHGGTVRYADRQPLPASPNRDFRYLVNQDIGCRDVTQFVGVIPPGRAGMHSHVYDEVVYVIEGEGILHLGDEETPIGSGSCIHLPPLVEHCLENTGANEMRVLGVFYPQGDPASRATESRA